MSNSISFDYDVTTRMVASCYEDRQEFMNKAQYYRLRLPDMVMPEGQVVIKEFFGTLEDFGELFTVMERDEWCRCFYASTFLAWECFLGGMLGAIHQVDEGRLERLLTPINELARASFLFENLQWKYLNKFDCTMQAKAATAEVIQVLLQDGDRYIRCCKYWFRNLERIHSEKGWIPYNNDPQGISSLFDHYYTDTVFSRLYIPEWAGTDKDQAIYEVQDEHSLILSQVSRELLSNY